MPFEVILTPSAEADLDHFKPSERRLLFDSFRRYLQHDANVEGRRRKRLRDNPLAPWELRVGNYRVFYQLGEETTVKIVAVGYKQHNELFIRGRRVQI